MNAPITGLQRLEKHHVRQSFDRAAEHYDDVAVLQREVGNRIIERLDLIRIEPQVILDVGSGTGVFSRTLGKRYKNARVVALDLAPNMLKYARRQTGIIAKWFSKQDYVCGDAEQLPLADGSVDLIFSSLALQWCADLDGTFQEFNRVLRPGGLLMFSTFGPDTLKELRHSWQIADANTGSPHIHVHDFIDMHDVGDALLRTGFADPVMDVENFTLNYPDAYQLMRELKTLGAHNVAHQRGHGLTGKTRINNMVAAYETLRRNDTLPATYEVVYGHAWKAEISENFHHVSLDSLGASSAKNTKKPQK
ncbi:MAG: malonyl-ACP O-methyltransferase BioC [Gammaproteobacteria bacterium]|nr:malonyl-ACP O-methyltransferase BioC [Gammaproteobacteria bacterium]